MIMKSHNARNHGVTLEVEDLRADRNTDLGRLPYCRDRTIFDDDGLVFFRGRPRSVDQ